MMNIIWIGIFYYSANSGVAMHSIEFSTEENCRTALVQWQETKNRKSLFKSGKHGVCVIK